MTENPSHSLRGAARLTLAMLCLTALCHCFGGWQGPLDPASDGGTMTSASSTPTPAGSPTPSTSPAPVASPAPSPIVGDGNTLTNPNMANPNTLAPNAADPNCQPIATFFTNQMWTPEMATTCITCHQSASNPFHFTPGDPATSLTAAEAEAKKTGTNNMSLLLLKPTGQVSHQGGTVFAPTSAIYKSFAAFVTAVQSNAQCVTPP